MGAARGPAGADTARTDTGWRERAVERSLRNARARAMSRSDRFIAAAHQLLRETGRTDFTVQEVVERSRMSLRSFYQHFASKDDLLLALFEELIRDWIDRLRDSVFRSDDPVEQLRAYVLGMYGTLEAVEHAPSRALTIYHLRLAESHPSEFAQALSPQIDLLNEVLEAGVASGQFRRDIEPVQMSMILTQTLVATLHMSVLGAHWAGAPVGQDALWAFCYGAVAVPGQDREPAAPAKLPAKARRASGARS
jgi:AcrR family transcriptional regulator